jgi:two-component system response regulator
MIQSAIRNPQFSREEFMMRQPNTKSSVVLLVEDSPNEVLLAKEAFGETNGHRQLHVVEDGAAALAFLRREGPYADAPRPDLILLDLNLPKKNGLEVLAEIKADDALKTIPVIVMTASTSEQDITRAYRLHANCYVTKPIGFADYVEIVRAVEHFWFTVATLPFE